MAKKKAKKKRRKRKRKRRKKRRKPLLHRRKTRNRIPQKLKKQKKPPEPAKADSDDSSEDEKPEKVATPEPEPAVKDDSDSEDDIPKEKKEKPKSKQESDSESSDDESESEKPAEVRVTIKKAESDSESESESASETEKAAKTETNTSESSSSDESDKEKETLATPVKDNKRKNEFDDGNTAKRGRPERTLFGGAKPELKGTTPRVFVGNLSFDIDDEKIKEFFKPIGEILDIFWLVNSETGDFRGQGFLTLESNEKADKAVEELDGKELLGRPIKIDWAMERGKSGGKKGGRVPSWVNNPLSPKPPNCKVVFLSNCAFDISEEDVKKHFKDCGEVMGVRWMKRDGEFKGAGFVEFATEEGVANAVKLCGKEIVGRAVRVDYAKARRR